MIGFKYMQSNRFWTSLSIVIVLFILGIYGLITIHSAYVADKIKEQLNIVVEFSHTYSDIDKTHLFEELKNHEAIISSSIQFLTKDDAAKIMLGDLNQDYFEENPFRDVIIFNVSAAYFDQSYLDNLTVHLKDRAYIKDVVYQADFQQSIDNTIKDFSIIPLLLGLLLTILCIVLIYNTVGLSLESNKRKIRTMELVGAKMDYIKRPYVTSALRMGVISAFIAIILLIGLLLYFTMKFDRLGTLINIGYVGVVCLALIIIGLCIPYLATQMMLSRHLRKIHYENR